MPGTSPVEEDIASTLSNLSEISLEGKTVIITGGAGFLGSWMCDILVRQEAKVICLDNLSSGLEKNIAHLHAKPNFWFLKRDISQPLSIDQKVNIVVHLASRASPFEFTEFPLQILEANTVGTRNALELARRHKARFLYASTSEVYGNPSLVPTPESYAGHVNPIGVRGCYDESKRCGEAWVMAYHRQYRVDVRIARIFNTYGPRMRADGIYGRVIPRFIMQTLKNKPLTVFGSGEQTRSFCYVTDQIEGLLRLALSDQASGELINIGQNEETKVADLAEMLRYLTSSASEITYRPLPPDDPQRRCPEITKAREILGWTPKVRLDEGLKKTINWFRQLSGPARRERRVRCKT